MNVTFAYFRIARVKDKSSVVFKPKILSQVSNDVDCTASSRISEVGWQEGNLDCNVKFMSRFGSGARHLATADMIWS